MRIEKIKIENFRLYKNVEVNFPKSENDIHILIGDNGVGKTTLLNAIIWCLYGDEPQTYSNDVLLPRLNTSAGSDSDVVVELHVKTNDSRIVYKRTQIFKNGTSRGDAILETFVTTDGQTERASDPEWEVTKFVPGPISDFYFFDGERLDNYFKSSNIEHEIFILSHIDLLEDMEDRLKTKYKDYNTSATKFSTEIEELERELEKKEKDLEEKNEEKENFERQIQIAKTRINKLDEDLRGVPNIKMLESTRNSLKTSKDKYEKMISKKNTELNELLIKNAPQIFLYSLIDDIIKDIERKIKNNELPTPIDEKELEKSLKMNLCRICGRKLNNESVEFIKKSLEEYNISSEESKILTREMLPDLKVFQNNVKNYIMLKNNIKKDFKDFKMDLERINEEYAENEEKYKKYDDENIKLKYEERKELEDSLEQDNQDFGENKRAIKSLMKKIKNKKEELDKAMEGNKKTKIFNRKKNLCTDALNVISETKKSIMEDTRLMVEKDTNTNFFNLTWKKHTFSKISVNKDYSLELIHKKTGKNAIHSASAAEKELLVLSFTLGIHKISGFDSPLLIDTPLARVSGKHRENFSEIFLKVSNNKQIILILTPDEYSDDVKEVFADETIQKSIIGINLDETESEIKKV
ncbi:MAG: AAA family ATPase [Methanobrevibacter sp.]|nr:AAA family ATPase [Methanobrevibacter sp.]